MKKENIDFLTAIEKLATEIGLKIPVDFGVKMTIIIFQNRIQKY